MLNERLMALAHELTSIAGTALGPDAAGICTMVSSRMLSAPLVVTARDLPADCVQRIPVPGGVSLTFDELSRQPHRALTAQLVVGVFDATKLVTREDLEIVEQLFFTRPRDTYAFVFLNAASLADADDVERVLRSGWRLFVPEPKPRWLQQNLAEHNIFLFDDRPAPEDLDLPFDDARRGLERLMLGDAEAADALARLALLHAVDTTLHALDGTNEGRMSNEALGRARSLDVAHDELASLRTRALRRVDSEAAGLQRIMETSIIRLRQDLVSGLDGALRGNDGLTQNRAKLGRNFQQFLSNTIDRWIAASQREIELRVEDLERDLVELVRDADWSVVNRVTGDDLSYPSDLLESLRRVTKPEGRVGAIPSQRYPDQPTLKLPHAGFVVIGSGVIYAVTALAGAIPAIVTSLLLGASGWAMYREQGIRQYAERGRGVIHGVTEQMRLQVEETIDEFFRQIRTTLKNELQIASDRIATVTVPPESSDMTPLRTLRDRIAALDLTALSST